MAGTSSGRQPCALAMPAAVVGLMTQHDQSDKGRGHMSAGWTNRTRGEGIYPQVERTIHTQHI
eukprot:922339-Pyramimonas_sp.AAC.1